MLENEQLQGAKIVIPSGIFERLVAAAENHAARTSRYVDTTILDGCMAAIADWLGQLEADRVAPSPTPERGDVLVKQDRGEIWMLTPKGWRELAPIELVADQGRRQTVEFVHEPADRDFLVGPSEAVRAGWDDLAAHREVHAAHREVHVADAELVVVLLEKGSVESGDFPDWIKPVYCRVGTTSGSPIIIRHPHA